jgi:hypothetical protein
MSFVVMANVKMTFLCSYSQRGNYELYLMGNSKELGDLNPHKAIALTEKNNNLWELKIDISVRQSILIYSFVLYDSFQDIFKFEDIDEPISTNGQLDNQNFTIKDTLSSNLIDKKNENNLRKIYFRIDDNIRVFNKQLDRTPAKGYDLPYKKSENITKSLKLDEMKHDSVSKKLVDKELSEKEAKNNNKSNRDSKITEHEEVVDNKIENKESTPNKPINIGDLKKGFSFGDPVESADNNNRNESNFTHSQEVPVESFETNINEQVYKNGK